MDYRGHIHSIFNRINSNLMVPTIRERKRHLLNLKNWINENRQQIIDTLYIDLGKPEPEVELAEIWYVLSEIKLARRKLSQWAKPKKVGTSTSTLFTASSYIHYEPKGVVLIIAPWNFPFNLAIGPLVSAIAAGNKVIIKPSELVKSTSELIERMVKEIFDPEYVTVFQGGVEISETLLELPFNHIFFTGSPTVGKKVMSKASNNLSSITLELGGKSPTIIDQTANLDLAVKKIIWGKFINAGQSCIAPDYILVQELIKEKFIQKIKDRLNFVFGKTAQEKELSPDYGRIVNKHHWKRLNKLLEIAHVEGANIVSGGDINELKNYIAPTILDNINPKMKLMGEEIFGPLLPIISYQSLEKCLSIINELPNPLALYIFSNSKHNIKEIIQKTSSGSVVINEVKTQFTNLKLPFGGVNHSGIGSSHGEFGFKSFSNYRSILKNGKWSIVVFTFPPYNGFKKKLIQFVRTFL